MLRAKNDCLMMYIVHFYPVNKSAKLRSIHHGLVEERDIDIPKTRSINLGDETVQKLAGSLILQVHKSRKYNTFLWRWG